MLPLNLPFIKKSERYIFFENQTNEDSTGKLFFKPKENKKFTYEGFLHYDLKTFAILYVEYKLLKNERNKNRLISILGFKEYAPVTKYNEEQYKIRYLEKEDKYTLESLYYKSFVTFKAKEKEYRIKSRCNLVLSKKTTSSDELPKLSLYSLRSSASKDDIKLPYIDLFTKWYINKMINKLKEELDKEELDEK